MKGVPFRFFPFFQSLYSEFNDFKLKEAESIPSLTDEYIRFFNEERHSYSLNYLTPKQFKEVFTPSK